jgi:valyl-tRNA synthetase
MVNASVKCYAGSCIYYKLQRKGTMKLPKVYEPKLYEADIYALWEKAGAFAPGKEGKSYTIVVPPPNANGNLHIGHALTLAVEDISVRYHRLKGDRALLLPGADHAGFETQVVFEKQLAKEGKSRFDFTREALYKAIWDFVANNRQNFEEQFRRLGAGVDWSHYTFTLDDKIIRRAYATFKKMWDEGLIYRGERLVNFCTFHGTAFADIEVVHKEAKTKLWHLRYPLTDGSGDIVVATTRPETMLGDTAVAVHPEDKRYQKFVGKTVKLPLTHREIPIIADEFVDRTFGTGAVKLTPAHDQNDYDAAERHALPKITIINHEGKLTAEVPEKYRGMTVVEARKAVADDLEAAGWLVNTEDLTHNVGHCYKCDTVIEPLLRDQWFVDMQPLAKKAIAALQADKVTFYPESKKGQLINYLEHLRDWNISRQIAWGIPIPAFQNLDDPDDWIYDERIGEEVITFEGKTYHRDPDVFDTWFSSSSWPYATLDFPDSDDFKSFYPLDLMETGGEILYPWVSRMLMLGLYVTGEVPFRAVYIHGYVLAEDGAKMSKSIGNVIDPIDVIDEYGSDALRMGIVSTRVPAVNRGYDHRKVEDARNFANKLWNVARYVEDRVGEDFKRNDNPTPHADVDHWILTKLQQTTGAIAADLENYRFAEAYERLYHFVWDDFADWYVEASKAQPNTSLLAFALESILKMAHPFAPFVTETIWQTLAWAPDTMLVTSSWPEITPGSPKRSKAFEEIKLLITEVRAILKNLGARDITLYYNKAELIEQNAVLIERLTDLKSVAKLETTQGIKLIQTQADAWLDIDAKTAEAYATKLMEQEKAAVGAVERLRGRLANKSYVQQAPEAVVAETRARLEAADAHLHAIRQEQQRFASL